MDADSLIDTGKAALAACDWSSARDAFVAALARDDDAEARFGLGLALTWLGHLREAVGCFELAYGSFRRRHDQMWAGMCAMRLGLHCLSHLVDRPAALGWTARAQRIVEEHGLDALRGDLLLTRAAVSEDPVEGEALGREALAFARRTGNVDLELCALSQLGFSLVAQGKVGEGFGCLDEAMAACIGGETQEVETLMYAVCSTMLSCARSADFERALRWVRHAERVSEERGNRFLYFDCCAVYLRILLATGDWEAAEEVARDMADMTRELVPVFHGVALAALAELRVARGAIEEASRLVEGLEAMPSAVAVMARIHLLRGRSDLARALVERTLTVAITDERVESGILLELLGEAELAGGDRDAAAMRGQALAERGAALGCQIFVARGNRLWGPALCASDVAAGRARLDLALATFIRLGMVHEVARTRLALAEELRDHDPAVATVEARAALTAFEALGAGPDADAAAGLLRGLGVKAARGGPRLLDTLTKREHEVLALLGEGLSNPDIARRLFVSRKTVEHHVAHVLDKLGLKSRAEAAAEAVRRGVARAS